MIRSIASVLPRGVSIWFGMGMESAGSFLSVKRFLYSCITVVGLVPLGCVTSCIRSGDIPMVWSMFFVCCIEVRPGR